MNRTLLAWVCVGLIVAPGAGFAEDNRTGAVAPHGFLGKITNPYRAAYVPPPNTGNSNRLDALLRGGNLYLSVQDTIALALENNLDIAIQRYGPAIAETQVMQADAGGFARGVSTSVTAGPSSASVSS